MAEGFPQFKDAEPVINTVNINSGAEGYEAFAKTLGNIGTQAAQRTDELVTEQSQAMYINSVANAEQLKTSAQIEMLKNPNQAAHIASASEYTIDSIQKSAFLNSRDRTKLNAYLKGVNDDIRLKATGTEVKQRQLEAAFTHYSNWPDQLKAYQQALMTDHDKAEHLKEAMMSSLHSLVTIGALTPEQAGSGIKTMANVVGIAQDHYAVYGNPDSTARDYHTVASSPLVGGAPPGAPINHSTAWMVDYYSTDRSMQGALADVNKRMLPNPAVFDALPPMQRQRVMQEIQGTQIADGYINSGEPFPAIQQKLKDFEGQGRVLSYKDRATKNALLNYTNDLKNGNYLQVMSRDPQGQAILNDFNSRNAAIEQMRGNELKGVTDPQLQAATNNKYDAMNLQNKDQMTNQAIAWAHGRHIPSEYIQPISQADVAAAQSSFAYNADPQNVMSMISHYSKQNQPYLANAMKTPEQRMIVIGAAMSGTDVPYQDKLNFIAANQTGRGKDFLPNKELKTNVKDEVLMNRIGTNLKDAMNVVSHTYDAQQAVSLQTAMLRSTMNAAKYMAYLDHNPTMEDKGMNFILSDAQWKKYVDQASSFYSNAFQQSSGTNWIVNQKQLPQPLSNADLDTLAEYTIQKGNDYISNGLGEKRYNQMMGRGGLKMIITPTNEIQAVNGAGDVAYSEPFNNNMLAHARTEIKKRREEEIEKTRKAVIKQIERNARQQLNVRLPEDANENE